MSILDVVNKYFLEESDDYKIVYKLNGSGNRITGNVCQNTFNEMIIKKIYKVVPPDYMYTGANDINKESEKLFTFRGKFRLTDSISKATTFDRVVCKIDTKRMYDDGYSFYEDEEDNSIYTTDIIPTEYVIFDK